MNNKNKWLNQMGMMLLFPAVITLIQVVFLGVAAFNGRAGLYLRVAVILWLILILLYAFAWFFTRNARARHFSYSTLMIVVFTGALLSFGALNQVMQIGHLTAESNAAKYIVYELFQYSRGEKASHILHGADKGDGTIDTFLSESQAISLIDDLKAEGMTFTHTTRIAIEEESQLLPGETIEEDGTVLREEIIQYNYQITASDSKTARTYLENNDKFPEFSSILKEETWRREAAEANTLAENYGAALILGILFTLLLLFMHGHCFDYWIVVLTVFQVFLFGIMIIFGAGSDSAHINLGPIQPLEFCKLIFLFLLTGLLCKPERRDIPISIGCFDIPRYLYTLIYIMINTVGYMLCGEMGTLLVISCVGLCMFLIFCENGLYRLCFIGSAVAGSGLIFLMSHFRITYLGQKLYNRFHYFLKPEEAAESAGYQYIQVKESLALSGWFGADSRYRFHISQEETDMAFSSLLQFQGVFFGILVILLFMGLLIVAYRSACRAQDVYYRGMGIGFCILLAFQGIIHISYNVGIFPITGIPLMYISSGGSNLAVSIMVTITLLLISSNNMHRALSDEQRIDEITDRGFVKLLKVLRGSFSTSWIRG